MIARMLKTFVVSKRRDRDGLIGALGELGVVHIEPVDSARAVAEEQTVNAISQLARAQQLLSSIQPAGERPKVAPVEAAAETLRIQRESVELRSRLTALHHELARLAVWGQMRIEQFESLRAAGVEVRFYRVDAKLAGEVSGDCVVNLGRSSGRVLLAVASRSGEINAPERAQQLELPSRDRPAIRAEAAKVDERLAGHAERLGGLAHLTSDMAEEEKRLRARAEHVTARRSGLSEGDLYAVQGWIPAKQAEALQAGLSAADVSAAVTCREPADDETPPTLIEYPRWARPIQGLFDILGTLPGYREFDVSAPFMIALPIFAAMLIGDGGYGALLLFGPLLFHSRASRMLGRNFCLLVMVMGATALAWGLLTASFFGVIAYEPLIPVNMTDASRSLIMRISFFMGAIHLSVAQLWRSVGFWPSLKSLCPLGLVIFIWGMLGVVKYFVLADPYPFDMATTIWPYLLMSGAALAIVFHTPSKNPAKTLAIGLANFPLSMLSAFSDVISYVRLMAVGLASGVLASSFNELAFSTGSWILAGPVLIMGHGLNIGLAMIAIFAHGVRLNMLEFSNNLGMQWAGQPYEPFAKPRLQEITI